MAPPPLHAAEFNRLAYNPAVTYNAPVKADGLPLTNSGTDAKGNYAVTGSRWASPSVDRDPFSRLRGRPAGANADVARRPVKDNLSMRVAVQLYCNTDWPILVNDPSGGASVLDAGDVNGQHDATKGGYCRINGTQYTANAAPGAPAAQADYNYPWQSSSGCDGRAVLLPPAAQQGALVRQLVALVAAQFDDHGLQRRHPRPRPERSANLQHAGAGLQPERRVAQLHPCRLQDRPAVGVLRRRHRRFGRGYSRNGHAFRSAWHVPATTIRCRSPAKRCSSSGAACNVNADCPAVPGPTASCTGGNPVYPKVGSPSCTSVLFNPFTNTNTTTTLLADANDSVTGGVVCRHNNLAYTQAGIPAPGGLFSYPRTNVNDVYAANKAGGVTLKGYPLAQTGAFTDR